MKVLDLSYHPLDCRSGGWVDLSRKGNHGTPHGGARPFQICPGVMGYWFNGSSGYVEVSDSVSLNPDSVSVGVWFKLDSQPPATGTKYYTIVSKVGASTGYELMYSYNVPCLSAYGLWFGVHSGDWQKAYRCQQLQIGVWYYAVGSIGPEGMKLYLNEELLDTNSAITSYDLATGTNLRIGEAPVYTGRYFHGLIAQPIIEDRAWSEAEVRENMYRSPIYRMLRGLPHSMIYTKVPWKQQGGIYVP